MSGSIGGLIEGCRLLILEKLWGPIGPLLYMCCTNTRADKIQIRWKIVKCSRLVSIYLEEWCMVHELAMGLQMAHSRGL